ncbi:hypothetical protein BDR07DRAFT_1313477, partial [Suillus spraguei]
MTEVESDAQLKASDLQSDTANKRAPAYSASEVHADASRSIHNEFLKTLNLTMQEELRILCCEICQVAIPQDVAKTHITKEHSQTIFDAVKFKEAVRELGISSDLPALSGPRSWRLRSGGPGTHQVYWEMKDHIKPQVPHQGLIQSIMKEIESVLQVIEAPGDKRMLTLQRLNSPDPQKEGISNTPFHAHQNKETMQKYILPIVSLLAMLMRSNPSEPFHFEKSKDLEDATKALQIKLD